MKRPLFIVWLTTMALLVSTAVPPSAHAAGWFGDKKQEVESSQR